jgi:hypothetical protein
MTRLRKYLCIKLLSGVVLGALLLLSSATTARASYVFQVFEDGASVGPPFFAFTTKDFFIASFTSTDFSLLATTTSVTAQNPATTILDSNLNVTLMPGSGKHTIDLKLVYTDYLMPAGSPVSVSTKGNVVFNVASAGDSASGQTWGNPLNTPLFDTGFTGGSRTASNPSDGQNAVDLASAANFSFDRAGLFALAQDLSLTLTGEDEGANGVLQMTTTVQGPAVPAPAALLLVLSGTPVLGVWGWLRRRQTGTMA